YSIAGIDLAFQTKVAGTMLNQLIEFLKRIVVEEKLDPLTRGYLAGGVLLLDARRASTLLGLLFTRAQLIEFGLLLLFLGRHQLILKRDRLTTEDTEEGQKESATKMHKRHKHEKNLTAVDNHFVPLVPFC